MNDCALFLHDGTGGRVFVHAIRSGAGRARGGCHRWTLSGVALRRLKNGNTEDTDSEQRKKTVDRGHSGSLGAGMPDSGGTTRQMSRTPGRAVRSTLVGEVSSAYLD